MVGNGRQPLTYESVQNPVLEISVHSPVHESSSVQSPAFTGPTQEARGVKTVSTILDTVVSLYT